ncbi:hypothetical protein [Microcoleus anatoxicus]
MTVDRPFGISQNVRSLFGYFWLYGKGHWCQLKVKGSHRLLFDY